MAGNLTFEALKAAVKTGEIDTVLVCFADMQGRLIGKRFHAEFFVNGGHEETHACDYLLANDIDMEPVPGYKASSWEKGYGDFVLKPISPRSAACRGSKAQLWCSAMWRIITTTISRIPRGRC